MSGKYNSHHFLIISAILYSATIVAIYILNCGPYLSYDEAAQFWIAKGVDVYGIPCAENGNLSDLLFVNRDHSQSPGGFGILLRLWTMVSNNYIWLRVLPIIFLILTSSASSYLSYIWTSDRNVAALMGFVPLLILQFVQDALCLNASTMEICGLYASVLAVDCLRRRLDLKRLILWSCILSIFLTSSFDYIIPAFIASLAITFFIFKSPCTKRSHLFFTLAYTIPLIATFLLTAIYYDLFTKFRQLVLDDNSLLVITALSIAVIALCGSFLSKVTSSQYVLLALMLPLCLFTIFHDSKKTVSQDNPLNAFLKAENLCVKGPVFIDKSESPSFRYLLEYGSLKGRSNYPADYHLATLPIGLQYEGIDNSKYEDNYNKWLDNQPGFNELRRYAISVIPELSQSQTAVIGQLPQVGNSGVYVNVGSTKKDEKRLKTHISITTDNNLPVDSKLSSDYRRCTIVITEGDDTLSDLRGKIKGRGNSTWLYFNKKPYKIKLDKASSILGMAPAREWVLLANARDVIHQTNNTGFAVARYLGIPNTNSSRYATVDLNGSQIGLYQVTEQIEAAESRINCDPHSGILLELDDIYVSTTPIQEFTNSFSAVYGFGYAIKFSGDSYSIITSDVRRELKALETCIHDLDWGRTASLLDIKTMIDYLIAQEFICNLDFNCIYNTRSVFIHKDNDKEKWQMGPLWDCDVGFGYDWSRYSTSYTWTILGTDPFLQTNANDQYPRFFSDLFGMPQFVEMFKARWNEVKDGLEEYVLAEMDLTEDIIVDAAIENMELWGINNYNHIIEYTKLREWVKNRFDYCDALINQYPVHNR